jgi:hypothetical protein
LKEFIESSSPWQKTPNLQLHQFLVELHKLGVIRINQMYDPMSEKMMDVSILVPDGFTATPLLPFLPPPTPVVEPCHLDPTLELHSQLDTIMSSAVRVPTSPEIDHSALYEDREHDLGDDFATLFLQPARVEHFIPTMPDFQHPLPSSPEKKPRTPSFEVEVTPKNEEIPYMKIVNGITVYNEEKFPKPPTQTFSFKIDTSAAVPTIIY